MTDDSKADAGLPGDPVLFKLLTEISIISNLAEREFERVLPGGLTLAQFGVLNHLLRLNVQQTVGELASAMQVAQPTMSSTIKKLMDKGYVSFIPDAEDRRVKRVKVTRAGRGFRDRAVKAVGSGLASLSEVSSGTDWSVVLQDLTRLRILIDSRR